MDLLLLHGVPCHRSWHGPYRSMLPARNRLTYFQGTLLYQYGCYRTASLIQLCLDDKTSCAYGLGLPSAPDLCCQKDHFQKLVNTFSVYVADTGTKMVLPPQSSGISSYSASSCFTLSIFALGLSILLTATMISIPAAFAWLIASTVCGITPSSAATTRIAISVELAPRIRIAVNASCPGVSRKVIFCPLIVYHISTDMLGDTACLTICYVWSYGSHPDREVLPWSTWPITHTTGGSCNHCAFILFFLFQKFLSITSTFSSGSANAVEFQSDLFRFIIFHFLVHSHHNTLHRTVFSRSRKAVLSSCQPALVTVIDFRQYNGPDSLVFLFRRLLEAERFSFYVLFSFPDLRNVPVSCCRSLS